MNARRLGFLVTICCLTVSLVACGGNNANQEPGAESAGEQSADGGADGGSEAIAERDPTETNTPTDTPPTDSSKPDTPVSKTACTEGWSKVSQIYSDAQTLKSCAGNPDAEAITSTLLNLEGVKINNNGSMQTPCIEAQCDDNYVYIITNALPHYDFVQTTPNALTENMLIYRLPLKVKPLNTNGAADNIAEIKGCEAAYQQYLQDPNRGPQNEPSGLCDNGPRAGAANQLMFDEVKGQKLTYRKLSCLGTIGFVTSGVPIFGPNEAGMPDPFGNPFMYMPDKAGESYIPKDLRGGAALDLCFGHTGGSMHYHGINEACFARNPDRTPKHTFATATASWDWKAALTDDCTKESEVIGWALDGVPIKGPCICTKHKADGSCETVKRARSSWVYDGLKNWGEDAKEQSALGKEGTTCTSDNDCCAGTTGKCHFKCKYGVTDDSNAPGGTAVAKRCMLLEYSWCTHRYIHRASQDTSQQNFAYLDRCNGYQNDKSYAYHTTASFPLIIGCFRNQPTDSISKATVMPGRP